MGNTVATPDEQEGTVSSATRDEQAVSSSTPPGTEPGGTVEVTASRVATPALVSAAEEKNIVDASTVSATQGPAGGKTQAITVTCKCRLIESEDRVLQCMLRASAERMLRARDDIDLALTAIAKLPTDQTTEVRQALESALESLFPQGAT